MLSAAGEAIVQLRVGIVEYWTLEKVTVLSTPDGSLVGAPFPHINQAMGQLTGTGTGTGPVPPVPAPVPVPVEFYRSVPLLLQR